MSKIKEYVARYSLTAGECNPQAVMPVTLLASRIIEVATFHANHLGVGYARLREHSMAWVLSRLSIEMRRWPSVNEEYEIRTWIEDFNRHYSERNFEVTSVDGEVLGFVRSIWMAIDVTGRRSGDISMLESLREVVSDRPCPIEKMPRLAAIGDDAQVNDYTFRYCDCDFNRHVNTVRYMELLLNQWDMNFYDAHEVARYDIAFMRESHFGQQVQIAISQPAEGTFNAEISQEGNALTKARIIFKNHIFKNPIDNF
jgi:acyl-ACP thioesterase